MRDLWKNLAGVVKCGKGMAKLLNTALHQWCGCSPGSLRWRWKICATPATLLPRTYLRLHPLARTRLLENDPRVDTGGGLAEQLMEHLRSMDPDDSAASEIANAQVLATKLQEDKDRKVVDTAWRTYSRG